jgi:excisionase family DNA binding protein
MTVKQVAEIMGWHPNTVYLRCTSGELVSFKSGNSRRIRREALENFIKRLEATSQAPIANEGR